MNILVSLYGNEGYCFRPDTTLEKESEDFYIPHGIGRISFAPVFFVRASKAGKCVSEKFAQRYYDCGGFGILLYGEDLLQQGRFHIGSILDHSSFLPFPLYGMPALLNQDNSYTLTFAQGKSMSFAPQCSLIDKVIGEMSVLTSFRTGDLIAVELAERICLPSGSMIRGAFNDEPNLSINLI